MTWWVILGPAGTPADTAARLGDAPLKSASEPAFVKAMIDRGGVIVAGGPDDLRMTIRTEVEKAGKLIKELDIAVQ